MIELDGGVHSHPTIAENDKQRDERLKELGYKVLRFNNQDLLQAGDFVIDEIRRHFEVKQQ